MNIMTLVKKRLVSLAINDCSKSVNMVVKNV